MLRSLLAGLTLFALGCGDAEAPASSPEPTDVEVVSNETDGIDTPDVGAAAVDTTGPARVEVAGETVPTRGVVTDMESGDISCYVTLREDSGATTTVSADYSVCDSNVILDRRVQLEYAPGTVQAQSCGGDPECLDTETVALAVVATPIDG